MVPLGWLLLVCCLNYSLGDVEITSPSSGTATAEVGGSVMFTCKASDGHDVNWILHSAFGDIEIEPNPPFIINSAKSSGVTTSFLTIEDVTADDAGQYSCQDVQESGDSDRVTLIVTAAGASPPADWISPAFEKRGDGQMFVEVEVSKELRLKCVGGRQGSELAFSFNDAVLQADSQVVIQQAENLDTQPVVEAILSILPTSSGNSGMYTCYDKAYPDVMDTLEVKVVDHPTTQVEIIEPSGTHSKVMVGSDFNIKCKASRQTNIEWYFEDDLIESEHNGFIIGESEDMKQQTKYSILTKEGAEESDSGDYKCVNADTATDEASIVVNVKSQDPEPLGSGIPTERRLVIMKVGSTVNLECSLEATPGEYTPEWSKDGEVICSGPKYSIYMDTQPSSLVVKNTGHSDAGIYQCVFKHRVTRDIAGVIIFNVSALRCPPLYPPDYGSFDHCPDRPLHGDSCTFRCHSEYKLTHSKPLVCDQIDGITYWAGHKPRCKRVPFSELGTGLPVSRSDVLLQVGWDLRLQCGHHSTWSKDGQRIHHNERYQMISGSLIIQNTNKLDAGTYDCFVRDSTTHHVVGIQKFNVTTLSCQRLYPPKNGSIVQCSSHPVYGETCIFRCNPGLKLTGNRARTCVLAGHSHSNTQVYWTGTEPICIGQHSTQLKLTGRSATLTTSQLLLVTCLLLSYLHLRLF